MLWRKYHHLMDLATDDFGMWPGRTFAIANAAIGGLVGFLLALVTMVGGGDELSLGKTAAWGAVIGGLLTLLIVPVNAVVRRRRRKTPH